MPAFAGHTTGRADRPHPALGQDLTPSSTTRRVATESFWSRLPAAVRPCGSAAELIGRRVKLFGLGRIWITRWPRELRRRGRPRRGRFRHAPGGRRSRDGEGRSARLARYGATTQWRRSALPTWRPDRVGAIRSPVRSSCLGGAPSLFSARNDLSQRMSKSLAGKLKALTMNCYLPVSLRFHSLSSRSTAMVVTCSRALRRLQE